MINLKKTMHVLIILGAVLACTAPFVHIISDNSNNIELSKLKKEYKEKKIAREKYIERKRAVTYFGYSTPRKFWYSVGKPITMLYFALILMYGSFYINEKKLQTTFKGISILGVYISTYFLVWAFWYRADFPEYMYYICIGLISILSTFFSYQIILSRNNILNKIRLLTNHIVFKGKSHVPIEKRKDYIKDYVETFNEMVD